MSQTILVVDDNQAVRTMLADVLSEEGYRVITAPNGKQALMLARQDAPDLVLLDIMMPEMSGYDFIRSYRRQNETPIILLTAKVDETDKVVGLELGADDYVTKPFGVRELVARIRAHLRRAAAQSVDGDILRAADIVLDKNRHTVQVGNSTVSLTPSEFDLLAVLMESPGRVFSRAQLLQILQGYALDGVERTIDVHIRNLRSKIEADPRKPRYVETVFGVGYRFRGE